MSDETYKINVTFHEENQRGFISYNSKNPISYHLKYDKYCMNYRSIWIPKEAAIQNLRYTNFMNNTGFVPSNAYQVREVCRKHKNANHSQIPNGFDHTTFWRKSLFG